MSIIMIIWYCVTIVLWLVEQCSCLALVAVKRYVGKVMKITLAHYMYTHAPVILRNPTNGVMKHSLEKCIPLGFHHVPFAQSCSRHIHLYP